MSKRKENSGYDKKIVIQYRSGKTRVITDRLSKPVSSKQYLTNIVDKIFNKTKSDTVILDSTHDVIAIINKHDIVEIAVEKTNDVFELQELIEDSADDNVEKENTQQDVNNEVDETKSIEKMIDSTINSIDGNLNEDDKTEEDTEILNSLVDDMEDNDIVDKTDDKKNSNNKKKHKVDNTTSTKQKQKKKKKPLFAGIDWDNADIKVEVRKKKLDTNDPMEVFLNNLVRGGVESNNNLPVDVRGGGNISIDEVVVKVNGLELKANEIPQEYLIRAILKGRNIEDISDEDRSILNTLGIVGIEKKD